MKSPKTKQSTTNATPSQPTPTTTASTQTQTTMLPGTPGASQTRPLIRYDFKGEERCSEQLEGIHVRVVPAWSPHIVLSLAGGNLFPLSAHLDPSESRAVTQQLKQVMADRRQIVSGHLNSPQLPENCRWPGDSLEVERTAEFYPSIISTVRIRCDLIELELRGANVRVRYYLTTTQANALIYDLERANAMMQE